MIEQSDVALGAWIQRWDRQQEVYLPHREERFDAMFTVLRQLVAQQRIGPALRVLDLGCGAGAIGQRLLTRFPEASYVGLDIDAALLEIARSLRSEFGERFTVLQRDLACETWAADLADGGFDVVASSTALHWLHGDALEPVFRELARLLRPNGIFLNADNLAFASGYWQDVATAIDREQQQRAVAAGREDWDAWWSAARGDVHLAPFVAARDRRFPPRANDAPAAPPPDLSEYVAALERAGFVDIEVLWQWLDDRLLAARRLV